MKLIVIDAGNIFIGNFCGFVPESSISCTLLVVTTIYIKDIEISRLYIYYHRCRDDKMHMSKAEVIALSYQSCAVNMSVTHILRVQLEPL